MERDRGGETSAAVAAASNTQIVAIVPEVAINVYQVSDDVKKAVRLAKQPKDHPMKMRNTLYAAIGRAFKAAREEKSYIPPGVIARFNEAQSSKGIGVANSKSNFSRTDICQ